jgi:hypothetical protein
MRHTLIGLVLVIVWGVVVWIGSGWLATRFPGSGPVLGFAGTVCLFWPSASIFVWDIMTRHAPKPRSHSELFHGAGYDPFNWFKLAMNFLGITLIGLAFGIEAV